MEILSNYVLTFLHVQIESCVGGRNSRMGSGYKFYIWYQLIKNSKKWRDFVTKDTGEKGVDNSFLTDRDAKISYNLN